MDYIGIINCKNFFMDFMFVSIKEDRRGKKAIKGEQKEKVKYESGQNGE